MLDGFDTAGDADDFVSRARQLRSVFAETSAEVDATGQTSLRNLEMLHEAGFSALLVPESLGGKAPDRPFADVERAVEIQAQLAAGESSTAHIWQVQMVARNTFGDADMPLDVKRRLADAFLSGQRWCSATAERGAVRFTMNTRATPVEGGIRLTGQKKYGTGSFGATYALATSLYGDARDADEGGVHFAIVRLDAPGVELHQDWDQMGQRATATNSITYRDVFVPDGWHWHGRRNSRGNIAENDIVGLSNQIMFTATILGSGLAALDALRLHLSEGTRPLDGWNSPLDDPSVQYDVGRYSAQLAAGQAMLRQAARAVAAFVRTRKGRAEASVMVMQAKIAVTDAVLLVSSDMFRNLGASCGSRRLGLDRFWRNARTLSLHDQINLKYRHVGKWVLSGIEPPVTSIS